MVLPADPVERWRRSFPASDSPESIVVTDDTVFAARRFGTSALDPGTGETRWRTDGDGQTPAEGVARVAGFLDGVLYTADGSTLRAYDGDGRLRWSTDRPDAKSGDVTRTYCLLPTPDAVFWGTLGSLGAYDPGGSHLWSLDLRGSGAVYPAVSDGRLYVAGPGTLLVTSRPGVLGEVVGRAPTPSWRAELPGSPTWPVVTDDRILVGDRDRRGSSHPNSLTAMRPDGSTDWSRDVVGRTAHFAVSESNGALLYVAVDGGNGGGDGDGVVGALDLDSGQERWSRLDLDLTNDGGRIALAGDTLVVAGFSRFSEKPVRGLDLSTGETRWTRSVRGHPTSIAVGGGAVHLATSLGDLVAFS